MKNPALQAALAVTAAPVVSMEDASVVEDLIVQHTEEAGEISPSSYFAERQELDADVAIIDGKAEELEAAAAAGEEVSLEALIQVVNAVTHRYGGRIDIASMEAAGSYDAVGVGAELNRISAALTNAGDVSLESFSIKDLWDKVGMMAREIPTLEVSIKAIKALDKESVVYTHGFQAWGPLLKAFTVDGKWESPSKAVSGTSNVLNSLVKFGTMAIDNAKKAADIATKTDWNDEAKAKAALTSINGIKNPAKDLVSSVADSKVMGGRTVKASGSTFKAPSGMEGWVDTASVDVTGGKHSLAVGLDIVVFGGHVSKAIAATKKQQVKVEELTSGLDAMLAVAKKVYEMRSQSARKWTAHKETVAALKANVKGSGSAGVARSIGEMDRMGWSAVNAAFTIISVTIREINVALARIIEKDKAGK